MLNYKELQEEFKKGDYVQIITESFNGGVGILEFITTTFVKIVPIEEKMENDLENLGTINHTVIFPIQEIKIIMQTKIGNHMELVMNYLHQIYL